MIQQDVFDRIVASLHEAMLDDTHWMAAAALINEAFGVKGNMLVCGDGPYRAGIEIFFARHCHRGQRHEEWERLYFDVYHPMDERVPRLRRLPDSRLVHVTDLYTDEEMQTSPVYNEALPLFDAGNSLNVRMDGPHGSRIVWVLGDPVDANGWSSVQVETIELLLPHLRQFVRVRQALADAGALATSLAELLDNTRFGVIQLDWRGRIVDANDRARDLLRRADGLTDQGGFLRALSPDDNTQLQRLLARALPPFGAQGASGSTAVWRSPELPRLVLHVSRVADGETGFRPRRVAAIVLVVDPGRRSRIDPGLIAETLGLTPAESEVAALLAEGRTLRDIAAATGRSESTIRWHLKHVFSKHGIARQAELVRLALSLADLPAPRG